MALSNKFKESEKVLIPTSLFRANSHNGYGIVYYVYYGLKNFSTIIISFFFD